MIGEFGKFQKLALLLIGFLAAFSSMTIFSTTFIAAKPKLLCIDILDFDRTLIVDSCEIWSKLVKTDDNGVLKFNSTRYSCSFDRTYYGKTIITDWGLICDRGLLAGLTQSIYMFSTFSAMLSGYIGDKYGRKMITQISLYFLSANLILAEILQSKMIPMGINGRFIAYCFSQFFVGLFTQCFLSSYVLLLELTTHRYHTLFSNIRLIMYVFGELIGMAVAYYVKDWHLINYALVVYSVCVTILLGIMLPESPRWLVSQKRYLDAFNSIKKIDRYNKNILKVDRLDPNVVVDDKSFYTAFGIISQDQIDGSNLDHPESDKSTIKDMLKGIFTPRKTFFQTITISYIWIVVLLLYFGVSLGITSIGRINPYLIFIFQCVAEMIGYTLCFINDKFGRRKTLSFYFMISSLSFMAVSLFPRNQNVVFDALFVIGFTSLGKCMTSAAFNTSFVYSTELYPTYVRNFVVLFFSCIGRIGSFVSPQINLLGELVWKPLPYLVFAICSLIAGLVVLFLPETYVERKEDQETSRTLVDDIET